MKSSVVGISAGLTVASGGATGSLGKVRVKFPLFPKRKPRAKKATEQRVAIPTTGSRESPFLVAEREDPGRLRSASSSKLKSKAGAGSRGGGSVSIKGSCCDGAGACGFDSGISRGGAAAGVEGAGAPAGGASCWGGAGSGTVEARGPRITVWQLGQGPV